jgi:hypothetical protein
VILLWGPGGDGPLVAVAGVLSARDAAFRVFDQHDIERIRADVTVDANGARGTLSGAPGEVDLAQLTAAYLRPYAACEAPAVRAAGPGSELWRHAAEVDAAVSAWAELTPVRVVGRPSPRWGLTSKPRQAPVIERCGFAFPPTLVTTDPDAVRAFAERHGRLISKGLSSRRSIVRLLDEAAEASLDTVAACPTQFQAWVPGQDVRVHVVAGVVFATAIDSEAIDYRYAGREGVERRMTAATLPDEVADGCRRLARALELDFAGIDLRRTPVGRWYCFEANPAPGFTFFSDADGQPVAEAVADLLASDAAPVAGEVLGPLSFDIGALAR